MACTNMQLAEPRSVAAIRIVRPDQYSTHHREGRQKTKANSTKYSNTCDRQVVSTMTLRNMNTCLLGGLFLRLMLRPSLAHPALP